MFPILWTGSKNSKQLISCFYKIAKLASEPNSSFALGGSVIENRPSCKMVDQKRSLLFPFYKRFLVFANLSIFLSSGDARCNESDGSPNAARPFYGHESNACRILTHWWCTSSHWKFPGWGSNVCTRWFIQPSSSWTNANDARAESLPGEMDFHLLVLETVLPFILGK